ncbi:ribokinase [Paenibacillus sp. NPDC058071]|uniref:ribokinase n=1 Tax=Paenibacillus sp. NPDC058071 TaxID=3346326 RepID=UPI0036D8752D
MNRPKIAVVGSLNMDIVVKVPRFPQEGETITGAEARFVPGGKGANQAVASARLGAHTAMAGAVGGDAFGSELLASLERNGVDAKHVRTVSGTATGIASITLAPEDNTIVVVPGANGAVSPADVEALEETLGAADAVLLQLEIPLGTVMAAAQLAKRFGKTVILNPAPARELPDELLSLVDVITPNRSELLLLTGTAVGNKGESVAAAGEPHGSGQDSALEAAIDKLLARGPGAVVTTLGGDGSVFKRQGGSLSVQSAYRVPVVDTVGAGDAYNAALAYSLALGADLLEAVRFASRASALAVTRFGAQDGMPTLAEVEALREDAGG